MSSDDISPNPPTRRQRQFALASASILVDVVVLNLLVEYVDEVVIDSFAVSVLAAVLIRLLVEVTLRVEHRVAEFFTSRTGAAAKVGRIAGAWAVLFLSKLVILETVDIVFGEDVELGGFFGVIAVSLGMVAAERAFVAVYQRL